MFCKNCGKEVNNNAVACMGCGSNPRVGNKYCSNCGAETKSGQVVCVKCGAALSATSSAGAVSAPGQKSKVVAGILAIFLGTFGAHKFYLGNMTPAIIMLAVSILGCALVVPIVVMEVIGFIEGIIYLTKSDADFQSIYVDGKKAWF